MPGYRFIVLVLLLCMVFPTTVRAGAQPAALHAPAQHYTVDVVFDPLESTISGDMTINWTNTTGELQESLPLRLYPNASHYGEGGIDLEEVQIDGEVLHIDGDAADPTVAHIPFADPVEPGAAHEVSLTFSTTIPIDSSGSFGVFRGNSGSGAWSLVNWYPIVAGWEPDVGWYLDAPPENVDPTFVIASSWDVTIDHPTDLAIVGSGDEHTHIDEGVATTTVDLEIGRELALMVLPADSIVVEEQQVGDTAVTITLTQADAVPGMHEALAGMTREAVERYTEWTGVPLAGDLDIVSTELDGALGVSWSGSIWLDLDQITADGSLADPERESLRFVVLHELAHQWMANLIGTNSNAHTWLTEGLASMLAVAVVRDGDGGEAAERAFLGGVTGPYRAFVNGGQDAIADSPIGELDPLVHSFVTYGKAAIGYEAIRQAIGDEAFFEALQTLAQEHGWDIVTPGDVLAAFESASGQELWDIWSFWFLERGATVADVDAVIAGVKH